MESLLLIAVLAGIALVVTVLTCLIVFSQSHRPAVWLAGLGAFSSPLFLILFINGRDIFGSAFWDDDRKPVQFVITMVVGFAIGLLPSLAVVVHYRGNNLK